MLESERTKLTAASRDYVCAPDGARAGSCAQRPPDAKTQMSAGVCGETAFRPEQGELSDRRMPVVERFVSVNGEGPRAGRLAAFVRFAGCNLRCSYCDTMWANEPDCPVQLQTVDEIAAWVSSTGAACTTLTGGEPALQPLLPQLVRTLLALPPATDGAGGLAARAVEIETNGAVDLTELARLRSELGASADKDAAASFACPNRTRAAELQGESVQDAFVRGGGVSSERGAGQTNSLSAAVQNTLHFTMDWKLPGSGMGERMLPCNLELLGPADTVKFVAGSDDDLREMAHIVRKHALCDRCAVYVSPVFGRIAPARLAAFLQEERLARVTLQLQLHKTIWPNVEKGV